MREWELELLEVRPNEFTKVDENTYLQRKDITEVEYHSIDERQSFKGFECYVRELTMSEYEQLTKQED